MRRLRGRLLAKKWLRDLVQALYVGRRLRPRLRFLLATARDAEGRYDAGGLSVALRGRRDLQAAREHLSKRSYTPPEGVPFDPSVTLDLGANIGLFTMVLLRRHPAARVEAVEPDADSIRLLRANLDANGLGGRVEVHAAAAGASPGTMAFLSGRQHLSRQATAAETDRAETVSVIDALPLAAQATFVKIDIEGGEWALLRDPRLAQVRATVAMEWHAYGSGASDAAAEAERLLTQNGFRVRHEVADAGETGFVWAWRPAPPGRADTART